MLISIESNPRIDWHINEIYIASPGDPSITECVTCHCKISRSV